MAIFAQQNISILRLVFSQTLQSWKQPTQEWDPMRGRIFLKEGILFEGVQDGGLEMEKI